MFVKQQTQDLYTPYNCVMMLLDSRAGWTPIAKSIKTTVYSVSLYNLGKLLGGNAPSLSLYMVEKELGFGEEPPRHSLTCVYYFIYKCDQRPFKRDNGTRKQTKNQ